MTPLRGRWSRQAVDVEDDAAQISVLLVAPRARPADWPIQHVADCPAAYLRRDDRDDLKLISYAERLGNGAVFKRLGFLAERQEAGAGLAELCLRHLSAGNAKLDPILANQRLSSKWRLRVPQTWIPQER
jgi:hypothetical protein